MKPMEPARFTSGKVRHLAEKAMVEGLNHVDARRLDQLLEASEQDRQAYDRLNAMFGALEGFPALTEGQHLRILAGVQRQIAQPEEPARPTSWLLRLGPVLAGALALLLLVLAPTLLREQPRHERTGSLQSRGAGTPGAPGARPSDMVDLRAWCVRDGALIKQRPRLKPHHADAECLLSDRLQMMITHTAGYKHLLVLGHLRTVDGQHRMLWYYPVPPTGRSGTAPADTEYAPLGQAIDLAVNHQPGQVRVLAVFSRSAMDAQKLYDWLREVPNTASAVELYKHRSGGDDVTAVEQRVHIFKPRGP